MPNNLMSVVIKPTAMVFVSCLSFSVSFYVQAKEKCQLPLQYLKESTEYQTNNNIKLADEYFDIGLSLHKLLIEECDSSLYRKNLKNLIKQHSVNQRALCSSGVRTDCFKNTNRMKKFDG